MNLEEFYNANIRQKVDYDGLFGYQCKDLFSFYNRDVVGNPKYVPGDAWQIWQNYPPAYYTQVAVPKKGDVAIWDRSFGGYGHVAIVWDGNLFLSQNYPINAPVSLQSIPTNKIIGYIRPKNMTYDKKMVRNKKTGSFALVIRGKKYIVATLDVAAVFTFMQVNGLGNFEDIDDATFNAIPNSDGLKF